MRAERAFASAGGTRGEQDVGDVVGVDRCGTDINGTEGFILLAAADELVPGAVFLLDPADRPVDAGQTNDHVLAEPVERVVRPR